MNYFSIRSTIALLLILSSGFCLAAPDYAPNSTPTPASSTQPIFTYPPNSTSGGVHVTPASYMTVTGTVVGQPVNGIFQLRNHRGRVFTVDFGKNDVPTDGTLTVYGKWNDNILKMSNFYYDDGLYGSRAYAESKRQLVIDKGQGVLAGTLVSDAEPDGFDLRDSKGVIHSIYTRRFLTEQGTKSLHQGAQVRVSGERFIRDGVSELDAGLLVTLNPKH